MDPAYEAGAPAAEEVPLVLVVEPQVPTWERHIVHFLQTGELPGNQDEAEKVAWRASMYQFVDDTLYRTLVGVGAIQTVFNPFPRRHLELSPSE